MAGKGTISPEVQKRFDTYPPTIRLKLEYLRQLIFDVASQDEAIGELEETLKWGQPSYLTTNKSGTSLRIDWSPKTPDQYAIYVHCQTTLIDTFRSLFPTLHYQGNRAIILTPDQILPEQEIRLCISMILRYHLDKAPKN